MSSASTHVGFSTLENTKLLINNLKESQITTAIVPSPVGKPGGKFSSLFDKTEDEWNEFGKLLSSYVDIFQDNGINLGYHNHSFEFQPMKESSGYDVFVQEFGDEMMFEVDVFWIKAANLDPVSLIKGLSGRISQLHLKDIKKGINLPIYGGLPNDAFKELGNGIIPMEPIIEAAKAAGVEHCHVEQDQSPDPIASIKESMVYLRGL